MSTPNMYLMVSDSGPLVFLKLGNTLHGNSLSSSSHTLNNIGDSFAPEAVSSLHIYKLGN